MSKGITHRPATLGGGLLNEYAIEHHNKRRKIPRSSTTQLTTTAEKNLKLIDLNNHINRYDLIISRQHP